MGNKTDYTLSGFDNFFRRRKPAPPEITEDQTQIERPQIPIQSIKGNVPKDQIQDAIRNATQITPLSTISAPVLTGESVRVTSTITDNENPTKIMNGTCETSVYQDNAGILGSVIPYGSTTIAGGYKMDRFFDFDANQRLEHPGKSLSYTVHVHNETGSTHTIYFYIRWRYPGKETV